MSGHYVPLCVLWVCTYTWLSPPQCLNSCLPDASCDPSLTSLHLYINTHLWFTRSFFVSLSLSVYLRFAIKFPTRFYISYRREYLCTVKSRNNKFLTEHCNSGILLFMGWLCETAIYGVVHVCKLCQPVIQPQSGYKGVGVVWVQYSDALV